MKQIDTSTLSQFAQAALTLDSEFQLLEQLSGQINRVEIESDSGMERARHLLAKFGECGQRVGDGVQGLARSLEDARAKAEAAAAIVSSRASAIQDRQQKLEQLLGRFQALGETAGKITEAVGQLQKPTSGALTDEQKALLVERLPELNTQLGYLVDEARKLQQDAEASKMTTLERNADSLAQSLSHARGRLNTVIDLPSQLH